MRWGVGSVIKNRLLKSVFESAEADSGHLCINDYTRLKNYAQPAALYYISSLQLPSIFETVPDWRKFDHSRCSADECKEYIVKRGTYVPKHQAECHDKSCKIVGPLTANMHAIIEQELHILSIGKVTSGSTSDVDASIDVSVVPYCEGMAVTAISHVWSDGMGNVYKNELPACLTREIYRLVRKAHKYQRICKAKDEVEDNPRQQFLVRYILCATSW